MNYLELEPNDTINTADLIPIGATVYANLPSRDVDYFKYQVSNAGILNFTAYLPATSGAKWDFDILNSAGIVVNEFTGWGGARESTETVNHIVSPGTYYLKVTPIFTSSSMYSVTTSMPTVVTPAPTPTPTPTYRLVSNQTSVNEGSTATFTLTTTSVTPGTSVPYTLTGVTAVDVSGGVLIGNAVVNSSGVATISIALLNDSATEGAETLTVTAGGVTAFAVINDTSTTPTPTAPTTPITVTSPTFATNNSISISPGSLATSSTPSNDLITGTAAIDTVSFKGSIKDYKVAMGSNGNYTVIDAVSARDGSDVVTNVERLKFSPDPATGANRIALDLAPTQAAGQAALLIGAILPGKLALDPSKYELMGTVIGLFDQFSLKDLSGALLRLPIWDVLTGKPNPTNADIATYLVNNVYGVTS